MKILIGIDHSASSEDVLRAMVTQFRTDNAEVRVLHVLQPIAPPPPQMAAGYAPELEEQKKPAASWSSESRSSCGVQDSKWTPPSRSVNIRESIIDSAAEWHADLIVVGSHGQRGIQRFLLGSVAEFVARHAKCSVEIVRASAL